MEPTPRVTVIVPTYNRAHWLRGSLEGILAQTYRHFVLVVADNASTDDTAEVVAAIDDERLRYVRRDENVGLVANHNLALADVETDYSLIIPDDDIIAPDLLEVTVAALDANPTAGMVHTGFDMIGERDELIAADVNWTHGLTEDTVESGAEFIRRSMLYSCRVCASTALMRMSAMPKGFFDMADFPAVDLGMWLRMALDWDMAFVAGTHGTYRIHGQSHSAAFGEPISHGYVQNTELVTRLEAVKNRFLELHGDRLDNVAELRRLIGRARRRELLAMTRNTTLPDRKVVPTLRSLGAAARVDRRMVLESDAWRLVAASILGPRIVERVRRPEHVARAG